MAKSIIQDPLHVPQKKNKVVKELPTGRPIPKEFQKLVSKGLKGITDNALHNHLVIAIEKNKAMFIHDDMELHWIGNNVLIYEARANMMYVTKDSKPEELTPDYYLSLASK